jgi:hypothetical protein
MSFSSNRRHSKHYNKEDRNTTLFLFMREMHDRVVCPFVLFLLAIVLSVLLRYADYDYLPLASSNSSM